VRIIGIIRVCRAKALGVGYAVWWQCPVTAALWRNNINKTHR